MHSRALAGALVCISALVPDAGWMVVANRQAVPHRRTGVDPRCHLAYHPPECPPHRSFTSPTTLICEVPTLGTQICEGKGRRCVILLTTTLGSPRATTSGS